MTLRELFLKLGACVAALGTASCGGGAPGSLAGSLPARSTALPAGGRTSSVIRHVVIVVQENRSFDDLFATFPGVDGATQGLAKTPSGAELYVPLTVHRLGEYCDFAHGYPGFLRNYDNGKMDGFFLEGHKCSGNHLVAYQYVNPADIAPYWTMARRYVLADHLFQTQGSGSFTAHQDLIAGGTIINLRKTLSVVDFPTAPPWGCDAPPGTLTSRLDWTGAQLVLEENQGPFPCFNYPTMRDLLDARSVSWRYYSPPVVGSSGAIWNAFDAIRAVRYGPEWRTNVTDSNTQFFYDIANRRLPAVSWVIPDHDDSDHPGGNGTDNGPSWVASIVNAVGTSPYWPHTAIVVVWDDWGGFYDHVPPPLRDHWGGLGFRVPMIVVSAYAPSTNGAEGYISHTQYEFGSILKFVEDTFGLGRLGTTDVRATSIGDCFDFSQPPHPYRWIYSPYKASYFMQRRPSLEPVDTE